MNSGANPGCSSGDGEGEEQEEPSSSSLDGEATGYDAFSANSTGDKNNNKAQKKEEKSGEDLFDFRQEWEKELESTEDSQENNSSSELVEKYEVEDDADTELADENKPAPVEALGAACADELAAFRQQWQRELEPTPPAREPAASEPEPTTDLEKAKKLFLTGAQLERSGQWYEAVQYYKRAVALVPDIERRIYEATKVVETPQEEPVEEEEVPVNTNVDEDEEEVVEGEQVVQRLLRIQARRGMRITPLHPPKGTHISDLPFEVLLNVLRWVVSGELDCASLERAGETCRAMHIAAREPDLWRTVCVRTWGVECSVPRALGFAGWRSMYVARPRLQLHGCYISKTSYLRHGENSFQDQSYRPWSVINYYRYFRFCSDGVVMTWMTTEEPAVCVPQLRSRTPRPALGIVAGHYRLIGDQVVILLKKPEQPRNPRMRARCRDTSDQDGTFHMELELRSVRGRRNAVLAWTAYRLSLRGEWTADFELTPRAFPPFTFSRVRSYTREAYTSL